MLLITHAISRFKHTKQTVHHTYFYGGDTNSYIWATFVYQIS